MPGIEARAPERTDTSSGRWSSPNRQAEIAHLGEVGALAAKEVAHVGAPFGTAFAESINPLHGADSAPWQENPAFPSQRTGDGQ
jgi:hypothetical protein